MQTVLAHVQGRDNCCARPVAFLLVDSVLETRIRQEHGPRASDKHQEVTWLESVNLAVKVILSGQNSLQRSHHAWPSSSLLFFYLHSIMLLHATLRVTLKCGL